MTYETPRRPDENRRARCPEAPKKKKRSRSRYLSSTSNVSRNLETYMDRAEQIKEITKQQKEGLIIETPGKLMEVIKVGLSIAMVGVAVLWYVFLQQP